MRGSAWKDFSPKATETQVVSMRGDLTELDVRWSFLLRVLTGASSLDYYCYFLLSLAEVKRLIPAAAVFLDDVVAAVLAAGATKLWWLISLFGVQSSF